MKLKIRSIADAGNIEKERVMLRVIAPAELGNYALVANRYMGEPMTDILAGYWFPFEKVAIGELVILYTKRGNNTKKKTESGTTNHFYYWSLEKPLWDDDGIAALLLEAPEWDIHENSDMISSESKVS
jgi:hypothetical protein